MSHTKERSVTTPQAPNALPADRDFASAFPSPDISSAARDVNPALFDATEAFWDGVNADPNLTPRLRELVLLALHAASSALNSDAIARHARRALAAGATTGDIADILVTIIPLANHPLYIGIPVLMDELDKAGTPLPIPPLTSEAAAIREDFISNRGYWTDMRDLIGQLLPGYFTPFIGACMEPWRNGSLQPHERELIYIAIDCTITHTYEPGLRMHIRNALRYGATPPQILAVFQLAGLIGTEGYILGISAVARATGAR